ncbi:MAG: hypothetical protein AAFV72_00315 [Cyanobacteria bacterium J06635_1]
MVDYKIDFDNLTGNFSEGETLTFGGGGTAELVLLYTGELYVSLISGSAPADNEAITGGTSGATADVNGAPFISRFPVKIRDDLSKVGDDIRWTGPALGTTHSCKYDGEVSGPFTAGETLTFSGGGTAELITLTDNGTDGELFFRLVGFRLPLNNETITGGTSGATAAVDGVTHARVYRPEELHYWYSDKGDDESFVGNDEHDRTRPRVSRRLTAIEVELLGNANIDDTLSYHMYGGSISQASGATLYSGFDISIVDKDGLTEPVIVQNAALLSATTTEYWKNSYASNAASRIRLMIKTRDSGADIDRKVARFRALEYQSSYFTAPDAQGGAGITPVSLVTANDGNNQTAAATVATWNDVTLGTGLQQVDHNNGNGPQPYWGVIDTGTRTKSQTHERFKWVQRRGTAETIYGLNAQLIVGQDLTVAYDNEAAGPFQEGETVTFGSGGTALILALDDQGTTGTLYCQRLTGDAPSDNDAITGGTSGATADTNTLPTTRLITNNLVGVFTGSDFNPANVGLTLEAADAAAGDLFTDLLGAQQQPPNNQSGTVNTAVGNVITAYPYDGTATDAVGDPEPDFDFLILDTALTGAAEVAVIATATIPSWVPSSGAFRITLNSGLRRLVPYSSYSGQTFSIASTDFSSDNAAAGNGVMPVGIDREATATSESFTGVFSTPQEFVIKVTRGSDAVPKQPAITTAVFGAGGFNVNVALQDD